MAYQDMTDDERAFAEEFNRDEEPSQGPAQDLDDDVAQPEDAETAPSGTTSGDEGEPPAVAIVVADGDELRNEAEQVAADVTSEAAAEQPGQEPAAPEGEEQLDPKEEQRRRSWEGRLRAREEELARREAALKGKAAEGGDEQASEAIEQAAESLEQDGDVEGAQRVGDLAEKVESGEVSAKEAMATLANDYGEDFVKMIAAIAANEARTAGKQIAESATGELRQSVQSLIEDIVDDKQRSHFEMIADAHPDFNDISQTPEFEEFKKTYPDGEQIADNGSARQIVKMLSEFKKTLNKEPEVENPAVAAAEGVRSAGIRIPQQPSRAEGYEEAWREFG